MDYADYVRGISFRLLQPEAPRPSGFRALNQLARQAGLHLEMWMTRLPEDQARMQHRLRRVCRLRRQSTFAIGSLINEGVSQMEQGRLYLALGVGGGFPLFAGMAGHRERICVGVDRFGEKSPRRDAFLDRFLRWKSPRHEFHELRGADYLQHVHRGVIGFCTCDGRRDYDGQWELLKGLEPHLADGASILIDDANWADVRQAVFDFAAASPFHYEVLLDVRTPRTGHPTYWNGVLVLRRGLRRVQSAGLKATERKAA